MECPDSLGEVPVWRAKTDAGDIGRFKVSGKECCIRAVSPELFRKRGGLQLILPAGGRGPFSTGGRVADGENVWSPPAAIRSSPEGRNASLSRKAEKWSTMKRRNESPFAWNFALRLGWSGLPTVLSANS